MIGRSILISLALISALPAAEARDIAVIVGNRDYRPGIPQVEFAHRDAAAMREFAMAGFGAASPDVMVIRNATKGDLESLFGSEHDPHGQLWRRTQPGKSRILVYYSGHGVPHLGSGQALLVPADADPAAPDVAGYPLARLVSNLAFTGARSISVLIDACFSGNTHAGPLLKSASAVGIVPRMPDLPTGIAFVAAARDHQIASWDLKRRHGLFTSYFLDAAAGHGDAAPGIPGDFLTLDKLRRHLDSHMTPAAQRDHGREQHAVVLGTMDHVIGRIGRAPKRDGHNAGRIDRSMSTDGETRPLSRGWIGVQIERLPEIEGAKAGAGRTLALRVTRIQPNGPAERAGIAVGDHIVAIEGKTFGDIFDLTRRVAETEPGQVLKITVLRDRKPFVARVSVTAYDERQVQAWSPDPSPAIRPSTASPSDPNLRRGVITTNANLREGPSLGSERITTYSSGAVVDVEAIDIDGWFRVMRRGEAIGYVHSSLIRIEP